MEAETENTLPQFVAVEANLSFFSLFPFCFREDSWLQPQIVTLVPLLQLNFFPFVFMFCFYMAFLSPLRGF